CSLVAAQAPRLGHLCRRQAASVERRDRLLALHQRVDAGCPARLKQRVERRKPALRQPRSLQPVVPQPDQACLLRLLAAPAPPRLLQLAGPPPTQLQSPRPPFFVDAVFVAPIVGEGHPPAPLSPSRRVPLPYPPPAFS